MNKKTVSLLLICVLIFTAVYIPAAGVNAYAILADEEPVYVESAACGDIYGFFRDADTDAILDPEKCNYVYGEVKVNGSAEFCHVYMRTFDITDAANFTQEDIPAVTQRILKDVKDAVCDKYVKCIAKAYYLRLSYTVDGNTGGIVAMTAKVFFACGERTEDRAALIADYITPIADELSALGTRERFLAMNDLILDGRFRYDMELKNRSSVVEFVSGGVGVCEEYAGFTSLLLDALGYENSIVTGEAGGVPHMWNTVTVDGRVYHLDILHDGPVDAEGNHVEINRDYLLVSEETVGKTHSVDAEYAERSALAVYDYLFDGYPEGINGTVEKNGVKYLPNVPDSLTVSELCEIMQTGTFMLVYKDGEALDGADPVCTGSVAEIRVNGITVDSCVICVSGDLTRDGVTDKADLGEIVRIIIEEDFENVPDDVFFAADMNGDGIISVTDAVVVYDASNQKEPYQEEPEEPETDETAGEVTVR